LEGATGILDLHNGGAKPVLWATDYRGLNDPSELEHITQALVIRSATASAAAKELIFTDGKPSTLSSAFNEGTWITSFSRSEDDLSLWRGYGGSGAGIALVFDEGAMRDRLLATGLFPVVCRYGEAEASADRFWELVEEAAAGNDVDPEFSSRMMISLKYRAAMYKHPAYKSESEVRIVVTDEDSHWFKTGVHKSRSIVVGHLELPLLWPKGEAPLIGIVVGPCKDQALQIQILEGLLADVPWWQDHMWVKGSTIPYRNW
jgi:hypothetical protein